MKLINITALGHVDSLSHTLRLSFEKSDKPLYHVSCGFLPDTPASEVSRQLRNMADLIEDNDDQQVVKEEEVRESRSQTNMTIPQLIEEMDDELRRIHETLLPDDILTVLITMSILIKNQLGFVELGKKPDEVGTQQHDACL